MGKIIQVTLGKANPENMNGVSRMVHMLADELFSNGQDVEVWGITPTTDAQTIIRNYPLRLFPAGRNRFRIDPGLSKHLTKLSPGDTLHFHGALIPEFWAIAKQAQKCGIRWIATPHSALMENALSRNRLSKRVYIALVERFFLQNAFRLHSLCDVETKSISRLAPQATIIEIPNGISQAELMAYRSANRLSPADGPAIAGFLGRLDSAQKGLDLLLSGLAMHLSNGGDTRLVIAGDGKDRINLEMLVRKKGLSKHVEFVGQVKNEEKDAFFSRIDYFVHTSRWEGIALAIVEALARSKPVLLTRETNMAANVTGWGCGFEVHPNVPERISAGFDFFGKAKSSGRLEGMAAAATQLIEADYLWQSLVRRFVEELYVGES